jgi:apolipoprotein N-acyltransferase
MTAARRRLGWPACAALAVATGLLLTLAYPPFSLSPLAWVALAPLVVAVDGVGPGAAATLGWLSGTVLGLGVSGHWLWHAAIDYFGQPPLLAAAFALGLVELFVAPFVAAFAAVVARAGGARRWWLVPVAWVATEWLRATVAGNPWELLGHAPTALPVLQVAALTGVYGLSFLLALAAAALAAWIGGHGAAARRAFAATVMAVAAVLAYGAWRLASPPASAGTLRTLLVQGDVANAERRPERAAAVVRRYVELSRTAGPAAPLVLWPENAVGVFPDTNPALLAPVQALARDAGAAVLTGAPRAGDRAGSAALYNAVYLITAGAVRPVYDKQRLLPFVERFPLRAEDGPYLPGGVASPVAVAGSRAGTLICFEVAFPELARAMAGAGADVLLNFSNDSWFDAGAGPAQHYAMARFRSIENRISLVRVTNSGISGAFDPHGRELARLPAGTAVAAVVEVPRSPGGSFYTRHGDWLALLCVILTAGVGAASVRAR